jgi:hypothetical protein
VKHFCVAPCTIPRVTEGRERVPADKHRDDLVREFGVATLIAGSD